MKRTMLIAAALACAVAGCGQAGLPTDGTPSRAITAAAAGKLVPGADVELGRTLHALRGRPVVVNVWASWCEPCRSEFELLRRVNSRYAGRVAFVGLDAGDDRAAAAAFLSGHHTPYPHISDPKGKAALAIGAGRSMPTTVFYDADGQQRHTAEGAYATEDRLASDIDRYALGS